MNVLDLVDPWLEFPVPEDRRGVAGRGQGHVWQNKCGCVGNTSKLQRYLSIPDMCSPRFRAPGRCGCTVAPIIITSPIQGNEGIPTLSSSDTGKLSVFEAPLEGAKVHQGIVHCAGFIRDRMTEIPQTS